ncbi:MAG: hypothetical protein WAO16_12715, partial [Pseudolabrys sp.]
KNGVPLQRHGGRGLAGGPAGRGRDARDNGQAGSEDEQGANTDHRRVRFAMLAQKVRSKN